MPALECMARVGITFENLLKASMASLQRRTERDYKEHRPFSKECSKIILLLQPRTSKLHETFQCKQLLRQKWDNGDKTDK